MIDNSSIWRGVTEVFPHVDNSNDIRSNLNELLRNTDRPLRVKFGIDPTSPDIHLGHSIPIRKLRAFQDAGHKAVLIIGDFTAQVGDPTGKSDVRPALSKEEVRQNAKTYLDQLKPILDFDTSGKLEIRYNSEWLSQLNLSDVLGLLGSMTVQQMLAKEGFSNRFDSNKPIYLHEFMYPLLQGYDSIAVHADIEIGGTDQKFNVGVGRDLQVLHGQRPQFGLLMPILIGTDGTQKMSKSIGNCVMLRDDALTMYSKLEKIPDGLVEDYFELLTDILKEQLPEEKRERQKLLALTITSGFHGNEAGKEAQRVALELRNRGVTSSSQIIPEFSLDSISFPIKFFSLLKMIELCSSSNEARQKISEGAVRLDGSVIRDVDISFLTMGELNGKVIQVGKKKFIRLV